MIRRRTSQRRDASALKECQRYPGKRCPAALLFRHTSSWGSRSLSVSTGSKLGENPIALSDAIIATYMTIHMARSPGSIALRHARKLLALRVKELRRPPSVRIEIPPSVTFRQLVPRTRSSRTPCGKCGRERRVQKGH
jgi:hypothetical protein